MEENQKKIILKTYRFVMAEHIVEYLNQFAKKHQHDGCKDFKENWQKWIEDEDVKPLINEEIKRLRNDGFEGDVIDKMFKSARYYYRNKSNNTEDTKEKKDRKKYETVDKSILENIDQHIHDQINKHVKKTKDNEDISISKVSPAESFTIYLNENKKTLLKELQTNEQAISRTDVEDLINKYKKIYKNRFYNIRVSLNTVCE